MQSVPILVHPDFTAEVLTWSLAHNENVIATRISGRHDIVGEIWDSRQDPRAFVFLAGAPDAIIIDQRNASALFISEDSATILGYVLIEGIPQSDMDAGNNNNNATSKTIAKHARSQYQYERLAMWRYDPEQEHYVSVEFRNLVPPMTRLLGMNAQGNALASFNGNVQCYFAEHLDAPTPKFVPLLSMMPADSGLRSVTCPASGLVPFFNGEPFLDDRSSMRQLAGCAYPTNIYDYTPRAWVMQL